MRPLRALVAPLLAALMAIPILVTGGAAPAGAAPAPLTIALIASLTGLAASNNVNATQGFLARIDLQNAEGGVNGHKLVPLIIDDQTSASTVVTGVQDAISRGAIGIVSDSSLFFEAAKYAQQAGVPVTGTDSDGPEWGEQPNTNMFSSDFGSVNPKYPVNTLYGKILKMLGGTRLAAYGYGISPDSARAVETEAQSFARVGGTTPIKNTSVPLGGVDFTSDALVAKQAHVNALWPNLLDASNFALATAFKQAGIKLKVADYPTGYEPSIIGSTVWQDVQGQYFDSEFHPFDLPDAGTRQMQAAMMKYFHWSKSQFPSFAQYETWLGADLMIEGIQKAGQNPTRASVIKGLRSITAYNGNGLLPVTIDYSTIFGKDPPICVWLMKAEPSGFVPYSTSPVCGTDIPGTSTAGTSS